MGLKAWLNKQYLKELHAEAELVRPRLVADRGVGGDIYLHIAHLRMLSKMAAMIMFGELSLIIVLFILLFKKGVL